MHVPTASDWEFGANTVIPSRATERHGGKREEMKADGQSSDVSLFKFLSFLSTYVAFLKIGDLSFLRIE